MLQVAIFDCEAVTWHFGFEDVVLLALDIGSLARSPPLGTRLQLKHMSNLQWYLGRRKYDPVKHVDLLECSCNEDVVQRYLYARHTLALGQQVGRWKSEEATRHLRVPVLLSMGGCCAGF